MFASERTTPEEISVHALPVVPETTVNYSTHFRSDLTAIPHLLSVPCPLHSAQHQFLPQDIAPPQLIKESACAKAADFLQEINSRSVHGEGAIRHD